MSRQWHWFRYNSSYIMKALRIVHNPSHSLSLTLFLTLFLTHHIPLCGGPKNCPYVWRGVYPFPSPSSSPITFPCPYTRNTVIHERIHKRMHNVLTESIHESIHRPSTKSQAPKAQRTRGKEGQLQEQQQQQQYSATLVSLVNESCFTHPPLPTCVHERTNTPTPPINAMGWQSLPV